MNKLLFICGLLFAVCVTPVLAKNRYLEVDVYPDPDASYIGVWTSAVEMTLLVINIAPNGSVKYCTSTGNFSGFDNGYGKVFKEKGKLKIIFEGGTVFTIVKAEKDVLVTEGYGFKYIYHRGVKTQAEDCKSFIGSSISVDETEDDLSKELLKERLGRLQELLDTGIISEEEYEIKRQTLINEYLNE
jgi:hypothetical protein